MEVNWETILSLDILKGILTALNRVFGTGSLEFNLSGYLLPVALFVFILAKCLYSQIKHRAFRACYRQLDKEVLFYYGGWLIPTLFHVVLFDEYHGMIVSAHFMLLVIFCLAWVARWQIVKQARRAA